MIQINPETKYQEKSELGYEYANLISDLAGNKAFVQKGRVLALGGFVLFLLLDWLFHGQRIFATYLSLVPLLLGLIFRLPLLGIFVPAHELTHYLCFWLCGSRATFSFVRLKGRIYAPGVAFDGEISRTVAVFSLAMPTIVVSLLCSACLFYGWNIIHPVCIIAGALHLGGCIMDWEMVVRVLRLPKGSRISNTPLGFMYRVPEHPSE